MADRIVLLQPRKVELASATLANLLVKVKTISTIGTAVSAASQDEIFSSVVDGVAGLFIGDASGKVQGATATESANTALTPVTTPIGLLPVDSKASTADDTKASNMLFHMYDGNTHAPVEAFKHKGISLLTLKNYIGGAAVASIGKVKVDAGDGADWLENKIENAGTPNSFIALNIEKVGTAPSVTMQFNATPNLSSQFTVTVGKQLTITTINGGSI